MLKCNINRAKRKVWVKGDGTAEDLMVELSTLIATLHNHIRKENPEAAKGFKNQLLGLLLDPKSPVWKEETKC